MDAPSSAELYMLNVQQALRRSDASRTKVSKVDAMGGIVSEGISTGRDRIDWSSPDSQ